MNWIKSSRGKGNTSANIKAAIKAGGTLIVATHAQVKLLKKDNPELNVMHMDSDRKTVKAPVFIDVSVVQYLDSRVDVQRMFGTLENQ